MKNSMMFALAVGLVSAPFAEAPACSAILVGKKASSTGYVIASHNDDGSLSIRVRHAFVPARDGKLGFFWSEFRNRRAASRPATRCSTRAAS